MNTITSSFIPTLAELKHFYKYVSTHINQTMLVNDLLNKYIVPYEEISGMYNSETDEYTEVFQWLVFPNFGKYDYEKLIENNIPVIESEYETWVGITSYGSHYDLYISSIYQYTFWYRHFLGRYTKNLLKRRFFVFNGLCKIISLKLRVISLNSFSSLF